MAPFASVLLSIFLPFRFISDSPVPPQLYTLSLHDALPILRAGRDPHPSDRHEAPGRRARLHDPARGGLEPHGDRMRSEEHTSELQSPYDLVCRLLLEKKKQYHSMSPSRLTLQSESTHHGTS